MNETMLERRFNLAQVSLFVAMGYFLTGLLGQLIAIPPGYATLFWPASGLALGSCLIWGRKALPGIYIGSFSINVYIAYASQSEIHLFLPCLIAASAVLQAFVGAALVNRFVGFPFAFHSPQKVLHFALLGGPVSSFINATLSCFVLFCFVLFFFGALDEHHLLVNWLIG